MHYIFYAVLAVVQKFTAPKANRTRHKWNETYVTWTEIQPGSKIKNGNVVLCTGLKVILLFLNDNQGCFCSLRPLSLLLSLSFRGPNRCLTKTLLLTWQSFSSFFSFLCSGSGGLLGLYFSLSAGEIEFRWKKKNWSIFTIDHGVNLSNIQNAKTGDVSTQTVPYKH